MHLRKGCVADSLWSCNSVAPNNIRKLTAVNAVLVFFSSKTTHNEAFVQIIHTVLSSL